MSVLGFKLEKHSFPSFIDCRSYPFKIIIYSQCPLQLAREVSLSSPPACRWGIAKIGRGLRAGEKKKEKLGGLDLS